MTSFRRGWAVAGACLAMGLALPVVHLGQPVQSVYAAEHVVFKNGNDLVCDHSIQTGDKVRIYTEAQGDNFLEVDADEIVSVEAVPDSLRVASDPAAGVQDNGMKRPRPPAPSLSPADLREMIGSAGARHNLDVDLLASVIKAESGGDVRAVSRAGAEGLMQLMPDTATRMGVADSFQPDQNINGGTAYLDSLLTRYHDNLALALAAYNAGPQAVEKYHGIPPYRETRIYVARVIREFNQRKLAEMRSQSSSTHRHAHRAETATLAPNGISPSPE